MVNTFHIAPSLKNTVISDFLIVFLAGKLIKRQRLPKDDVGDHWHWRDLNNGTNVTFYGKIFHIHNCDKWTQVHTLPLQTTVIVNIVL